MTLDGTGPGPTSTAPGTATSEATTDAATSADSTAGSSGGASTTDGGNADSGGSTGTGSNADTGGSTGVDPCAAGDGPDFTVTNFGASDYVIDGVNDPVLTVVAVGAPARLFYNCQFHASMTAAVNVIGP
jgi:hypothetical protein